MSRRLYTYIMLVATIVLSITGCMDRNRGATVSRHPKDTLYTEQQAMEVYDYDPVRALEIMDSAVIVGNLPDWWADFYRARIYSSTQAPELLDSLLHGVKGAAGDTARVIAERLLCHDSIKASLARQQDVLEVLAHTARQQDDTLGWLQRSRELVEVCHGQGAETEALRNEAEVGTALCFLGKETEGMARIDSVIALLDVKKFNELDAMLIVLKRKVCVLADRGHYAEMLPPARQMLERLSDYEQHPDRYHDGSYREPKASTERQDYIEFYRSKAQKYIAAAYAAIGESGSMEESFRQLEAIVRDAAARERRARYQAIEQQMQRQEAEARADRSRLTTIIFAILLATALCALVWYWHQKRVISRKNRVLVRQIDEAMTYKQKYEEVKYQAPPLEGRGVPTDRQGAAAPHPCRGGAGGGVSNSDSTTPDDALFAQIHDTIVREQLYLNPACDRQMLIDRFGLSKERIGAAFAKGSNHPSLSAYINDLRLEHAYKLLLDQPGLDLGQVALQSGFSSRKYFGDRFKSRYGMTPSEFRAAQQ